MTGDARDASAAIESWLAARETVSAEAMDAVLKAVAAATGRLARTPLVAEDDETRRLVEQLASAADMDEFAERLERLEARVAALANRPAKARRLAAAAASSRGGRTVLKL